MLERGGILKPIGRLLGKTARNQGLDVIGDVMNIAADRRRRLLVVQPDHHQGAVGCEGNGTSEHLVEDDP